MPPDTITLQKIWDPLTNYPLLHTGGVFLPVDTTYARTHKHTKDVTKHIRPDSLATRGFYLIHT